MNLYPANRILLTISFILYLALTRLKKQNKTKKGGPTRGILPKGELVPKTT